MASTPKFHLPPFSLQSFRSPAKPLSHLFQSFLIRNIPKSLKKKTTGTTDKQINTLIYDITYLRVAYRRFHILYAHQYVLVLIRSLNLSAEDEACNLVHKKQFYLDFPIISRYNSNFHS